MHVCARVRDRWLGVEGGRSGNKRERQGEGGEREIFTFIFSPGFVFHCSL